MPDPAPGTVVLFASADRAFVRPGVVLAVTEEGWAIAPVSDEVAMATDWDLLLPPSVLGYAAVAEIWNHGTVLPEQVDDILGSLPDSLVEALLAVAHAARRGDDTPEGVPVGAPVLDDADPRLLFQDAEAEACRDLWEPALTLAGAATLGQVVLHRRAEIREQDWPAWVADLEADRLYLPWQVPSSELASLMQRLRIGASRRLGFLTRSTIEALQPSLARGATTPPPPDAPSPDAYVEQFLDELRKES